MTVQELMTRFPEIPADLQAEPVLSRYVDTFGDLLSVARNPGACSARHDAANHYYLKLVGPLAIYGYGLSTRERVVRELQELLDRQREDPAGFAAGLVPPDASPQEMRGPGCS